MQSRGGGSSEHMFQALHVFHSGTMLRLLMVHDHSVHNKFREQETGFNSAMGTP